MKNKWFLLLAAAVLAAAAFTLLYGRDTAQNPSEMMAIVDREDLFVSQHYETVTSVQRGDRLYFFYTTGVRNVHGALFSRAGSRWRFENTLQDPVFFVPEIYCFDVSAYTGNSLDRVYLCLDERAARFQAEAIHGKVRQEAEGMVDETPFLYWMDLSAFRYTGTTKIRFSLYDAEGKLLTAE